MRIYTIFIIVAFLASDAYSQVNNGGLDQFGRPIFVDTSSNESDTIINKNSFFSLFKGKPGRAAFYSLVIPGGGQVYNKRWWKVPIALGIDGGLTYVLIRNRDNYRSAQALYEAELLKPNSPLVSRYKEQRDYYRKWSEYAWVWLIAGHLMTVIDAFVDRHLMDFDVSPDLSLGTDGFRFEPSEIPITLSAGIKINLSPKTEKSPNSLYPSR